MLVEAKTYRWHGHYEGDAQPYKPEHEASEWRNRDPLVVAAARLLSSGSETEQRLAEIRDGDGRGGRCGGRVRARRQFPAVEEAYEHVYRD